MREPPKGLAPRRQIWVSFDEPRLKKNGWPGEGCGPEVGRGKTSEGRVVGVVMVDEVKVSERQWRKGMHTGV